MLVNPTILRAYDIRGIFGESLNVSDSLALSRAFAVDLLSRGGKTVCVAHDVRLSSPELEAAVVQGLLSSGLDVARVGMGPSPMLYFAQKFLETDAGLMITGSHNPGEYNGIKICLKTGPYFGDDIQNLGVIANEERFVDGHGQLTEVSVIDDYVARLMQDFNKYYTGGKPLNVVWDPSNGASCPVVEKLIQLLPGKHIIINGHPDGTFPAHHPDPCVLENMQQLAETVVKNGFDLGIGFDGDGDRIGVVDGKGRMLMGDQLLAFYGEELAKTHPSAVVLADVKSSKALFDRLALLGLKGQLTRTGHSYIKSCMKALNCPLAGEMSGHMFFADRYYGYDDGLYAAIRLLGPLSLKSETLSDWMDAYPQTHIIPEKWHACADEKKFDCIDAIKQTLKDENTDFVDVDGIRVTTPDGWWLIRASNTQAVIVSRAESDTAAGLALLLQDIARHLEKQGVKSI